MSEPDNCTNGTQNGRDELRGADRYALMIRGAKLVSESGQYLCIIRDVSETGVRLRLFHTLPPAPQLALELANGDFFFIERVWERDEEAGFRFAAPIDIHAFMEEPSPYPRRPLRLRIRLDALIFTGDTARDAVLLDLSQYGARVETPRPLAIGQMLKLEAAGLPPLFARVCWRLNPQHGLVFQQTFAFDRLARVAGGLQGCGEQAGRPGLMDAGQARYG